MTFPFKQHEQQGAQSNLRIYDFFSSVTSVIKLFRILIEIILHSDNRLMIDEIDAGVHISRFKDFWRTILKASVTHNVQLFATTHNWECLQVFKEVLEEPEMQEYQEKARCFKLAEMRNGSVKSYCATFEEFQSTLESGFDPREVWQ
jgi:AAA15 family ATPase/GTPase